MLTQVKTNCGKAFIKTDELQRAKEKGRSLIKIYRKDGSEKLEKAGGYCQLLHIENIAI